MIRGGYVALGFLWTRHGRQGRDTGSAGRWIDGRDVHRGGAFRLAVLLQGKHGEVMGGSGGEVDAGIYRSAWPLVDEGVVPEHFHGFDGSGEAGGDGSRHLYRRCDGAVTVGGGDGNSAAAGEGGGEINGRGMPMLEECYSSGRQDQERGEDNVLDKAALGMGNMREIHK